MEGVSIREDGRYDVVVGGVSFGPYATADEANQVYAYLAGGQPTPVPCGAGQPTGVVGGVWRCVGGQWTLLPDATPGPPSNTPPTVYIPPQTSTAAPVQRSPPENPAPPAVVPDTIDRWAGQLGVSRTALLGAGAILALAVVLR